MIGVIAFASLAACNRASEGRSPAGRAVDDDVKGVAKATEKAAKDIGQATVELGDKARKGLEDVTNKAGEGGQDAWITTKVKSELTTIGIDVLHVHVDTDAKVVTLSGTVESSAEARKAIDAAKTVKDVVSVQDHLFVKPTHR